MSVRGSAKTVNLVDLLGLIQSGAHAGTLGLRDGERASRLHFFRGRIYLPTGGSSGALKIGSLLIRANKITGRDLLRALQLQKEEGHKQRLGDLLVREKLVTQGDLDEVIRGQFEEEICDLLFDDDAEYEFRKDVLPAGFTDSRGNIQALGFDIRSILMEASRRQDEWHRIRSEIPSGRAILRTNDVATGSWQVSQTGEVRERSGPLNITEQILSQWKKVHALFEENPFDGLRSVDEVVAQSGIPAFTAMGIVAELKREGTIRNLSPNELRSSAQERLEEGKARPAYRLYEWANESDRLRPTASRLDKLLLRSEHLEGTRFQTRTSSVRALQILSRLLRRGAPFHYMAREGESMVEVYYTPTSLRLHLMGPRRTHSTTRYLRRRKAVSSKSLHKARQTAKLERRSLDRVLLDDGFVTKAQWIKAVKDKVVSGLFSMFGWSEPYLEVQGGVVPPQAPEDVAGLVCEIPLSQHLHESLRRDMLRWKVLLKHIPAPDVVCVCARPTPKDLPRRAHDLFNGRRTVGDLIQLARVAPLELVRFVYDSIQSEKVRPLTDREHYERIEKARNTERLDDALAYCKSAIAWGYARKLYHQRLNELRKAMRDSPHAEARNTFQGDVRTFSLAEVLQVFHQGKKTGTLRIREAPGDREKVFYLDGGDLYVLKVEHSESEQEVWDLLLGDETRTSIDLGNLLKRKGLIEEAELSQDELQGVKEEIFETFLWDSAEYKFTQNLLPSELRDHSTRATKLKLRTAPLLMEAMGRLAEWDDLRKFVRSARAVFRYATPAAQLKAVAQGMGATAYLYDGKHSLADIVRVSGEDRFKVYRDAKALIEKGELKFQSLKTPGRRLRRGPAPLASGRIPRLQISGVDLGVSGTHGDLLNSEIDHPHNLGDSMETSD